MIEQKIAKIEQSKLRESVYGALRDAFTRGAFAPGETLSLRSMADQLGTSITPVREAVRRIVAEGGLIDTPSRTLMVPPFDVARMHELKAARLALETLLLEQAFECLDVASIDALAAVIKEPRQGESLPDLQQNYDFHFGLYRLAQSSVILPLVEALWLQYGPFLHLAVREQAAAQMAEHQYHELIIKALRQGDLDAAIQALSDDIERSFQLLFPDV